MLALGLWGTFALYRRSGLQKGWHMPLDILTYT